MKDIRIDNRTHRVFVLKETDERMVYIPIKALHRVDYDRLVKLEEIAGSGEMLEVMSTHVLDNGLNALVVYDSLIQVLTKTTERTGNRLLKPNEKVNAPVQVQVINQPAPVLTAAPAVADTTQATGVAYAPAETPAIPAAVRRRPGPKPKVKLDA